MKLLFVALLIIITSSNIISQNATSNQTVNDYSLLDQQITSIFGKQFDQVWFLIKSKQNITPKDGFINDLQSIYNAYGPIAYDLLFEINKFQGSDGFVYSHVVAYKNSIKFGLVQWNTYKGQIFSIDFGNMAQQLTDSSLVDFFYEYSGQVAISVFLNGKEALRFNGNRQQPIDAIGTVPIVLEYARQVQTNLIYPEERIPINHLKKFYIPKVDIGFATFLTHARQRYGYKKVVPLSFIASEMTSFFVRQGEKRFGSPALVESLQDILGLQNIDDTIKNIGLNQTKSIYPVSTTLAFTNFKALDKKDYNTFKTKMTAKVYYPLQNNIHTNLLKNKAKSLLDSAQYYYMAQNFQAAMYKWQVQSTTSEYAMLFQRINKGQIMNSYILDIAKYILNPLRQKQYFEKQLFTANAGVVVQTKDLYNAVGYSTLIKPINGIQNISFALFVQGLTKTQQDSFANQLQILTYFVISDPAFTQDLAERLRIKGKQ